MTSHRFRSIKLLFLILGIALLGAVVAETDVVEAARMLDRIGWGFAALFALYLIAFALDAYAWQIITPGIPPGATWLYRFFQVRLAGEAFNTVTPTASMGGEAVKAVMLKTHYDVDYRDGTASLILAKTVIVVSLVAFLAVGFILMLGSPKLTAAHKAISGAGLAAFALGIGLFFLVQRYKIASLAGTWLGRSRWFAKLNDVLHHLHEVENRLVHFYTRRTGRMMAVFALTFASWALGAAEVWLVMYLIGSPIGFADAWIIETAAQLVRSATFFIPASIGAQDGAFLIAGAAITGQPSLGLTVALARRIREIAWVIWGLAVFYLLKPRRREPEA